MNNFLYIVINNIFVMVKKVFSIIDININYTYLNIYDSPVNVVHI